LSLSSIPRSLRQAVRERDIGRCRYCRLVQFGQGASFHIDHIIPRSKGGATSLENLALQCPSCSLHKADRIEALDETSGGRASLFHPLRDVWDEHFRLDTDGRCVGLSPVGRATVTALHMNDVLPRFARACQIVSGLLDTRRVL